jgi:iron complex outermembrane receptor protein
VPFDPETGQQYEAGIKYQPPGRKSLVTFSAFDITRQNYLTFDNQFNPRQTGEILSRGLEVEVTSTCSPDCRASCSSARWGCSR